LLKQKICGGVLGKEGFNRKGEAKTKISYTGVQQMSDLWPCKGVLEKIWSLSNMFSLYGLTG